MEIQWDAVAWENYDTAEADPPLATAYDDTLDNLISDPQPVSVRLNRLSEVDAWLTYVRVRGREQKYAIIWRVSPPGTLQVLHLGPWGL